MIRDLHALLGYGIAIFVAILAAALVRAAL